MSKTIITAVTLLAVSMHVLLGCCWHHDHPSETATVAHHEHSEDGQDDGHSEDGHDHESCEGADCDFYSADNSDLELTVASSFSLPVSDNASLAALLNSVRRASRTETSTGSFQLPEPLHALMQVWLI